MQFQAGIIYETLIIYIMDQTLVFLIYEAIKLSLLIIYVGICMIFLAIFTIEKEKKCSSYIDKKGQLEPYFCYESMQNKNI